MTKREFYETLITKFDNAEDVALKEMAMQELATLDKKNEKAKVARLAKSAENAPIVQAIVEYLTTHKKALANELATVCNVSTPKVVAVAKKMTEEGVITCEKVKIPKVGERNAYALVVED